MPPKPVRMFIGNLPYSLTTAEELTSFLQSLGITASNVKVPTDQETGAGLGFAFVELATEAAFVDAIAMANGARFNGRPIRVDRAVDKPRASGPRPGDARGR